jgi:hypothetical protein
MKDVVHQSLPKEHEDGTSISTGSSSPLPKGLISDRSVNSAGDCMISPTTCYGPNALVGMSVKGKRSRALAGHLEWGDSRLRAWTRSVLGGFASSELVECNGKKSVS